MINTFFSKREERRLKIPSEETNHINVPSTSKINTPSQDLFFFSEKETSKDPRRREQAHNCALDPKRIELSNQDLLFQREGNI